MSTCVILPAHLWFAFVVSRFLVFALLFLHRYNGELSLPLRMPPTPPHLPPVVRPRFLFFVRALGEAVGGLRCVGVCVGGVLALGGTGLGARACKEFRRVFVGTPVDLQCIPSCRCAEVPSIFAGFFPVLSERIRVLFFFLGGWCSCVGVCVWVCFCGLHS